MKYGLGESYDKVDVLPVKLRAWLDLTKPASTVGVMGAAFLASLFYFYYTGTPELIGDNFSTIIFVVVTVGLAHGASQTMNMVEDAHIDAQTEHKKDRPIPSGVVTKEEGRTLAWILILAALGRSYLINAQFGIFVTLTVFMGIFYNLNPIRAKERIISIPWQAVSRGMLSFPLIWSAYGNIWRPTPWVLGLFMFFYVLGFQNTADIIDRHIDEEYNIKTFVVVYGVRKTVLIAFGSTMMMLSVIALAVPLNLIPDRLYTMVLILPLCLYMLIEMWNNPHKVSEKTGNHPAWLFFYGGMMMCIAIPLATEIILS
jgi:4-hydroxybenzoate polyprenyltransferase